MLSRLKELVDRGGPEPSDYAWLSEVFPRMRHDGVPPEAVAQVLAPTLTSECLHGYGYLKPRGYAGDYLIIDRTYTEWVSSNPALARWDRFYHAQPATRAVRNRKSFFKKLLQDQLNLTSDRLEVLNLASGPARDVAEFFQENPSAQVRVHCVDLDPGAVRYATQLCAAVGGERVTFECRDVLRLRPRGPFDVIWSAGLFDYLPDRVFVTLLRRLYSHVRSDGELIVGNFSPRNPSRAYMELLGDWRLIYRTPEELTELALSADIPRGAISVTSEEEGVNLFLRLAQSSTPVRSS